MAPGALAGWDMKDPLGVVSVGQVGLKHAFWCENACIAPGSLLDCRIADRELAPAVVLDGSAGLPATSPWSVLFAGSGCLGSSSVRAMGRVIKARRCYAGGVEIW